MSKELRPCPFCGEKVTLDYRVMPNRKHWFITCDCCGMMYQDTLSQRKYVKDGWNSRPIEDNLIARIAELESMVERLIELGDVINGDKDSVWTLQTIKERWTIEVAKWKERE